jgi:uroporphyrinogen decarboxylase
VASSPLRSHGDLERLRRLDADADVPYVVETVHALVQQLPTEVPVLAFAGAPFTVASYLIEGSPSRTYRFTKQLIHTDPALWHAIMERLAQHSVAFVDAQLRAGARAFQLFDSWAGALSADDYRRFVLPHSTSVFTQLGERHPGVPGIHFGIGCDHLLELMLQAARGSGRATPVLGLDWRTGIAAARRRMGDDLVVQGNLDPALVLAGADVALAATEAVLADNGGHPGHVFNLGHGVQPETDPDVLASVVQRVHQRTAVQATQAAQQ